MLIKFWKKLTDNNALIHPDDFNAEPSVFTSCYPPGNKNSNQDFVSQISKWRHPGKFDIHKLLVPQPYCGSLEPSRGKIYLIMLNPGFNPFDYAELDNSSFNKAVWNNLHQEEMEYPFIFLDPKFWWHPGYQYWHKRLTWLFQSGYTPLYLSKLITSLESFPYHSETFPASNRSKIARLPSVKFLIRYVEEILVPKALAEEVLIVIIRGKNDHWTNLPTCTNIIFKTSGRSSYIQKESAEAKKIIEFLNFNNHLKSIH